MKRSMRVPSPKTTNAKDRRTIFPVQLVFNVPMVVAIGRFDRRTARAVLLAVAQVRDVVVRFAVVANVNKTQCKVLVFGMIGRALLRRACHGRHS